VAFADATVDVPIQVQRPVVVPGSPTTQILAIGSGATLGADPGSVVNLNTATVVLGNIANLTALGSNQAGAAPVLATNNVVTTTGSGQGILLPSTAVAGQEISVMNGPTNAVNVYPDGTGTINGGSASAAKSLAPLTGAPYLCLTSGPNATWYSLSN
jgi:hypothetical protein